jgi:hypothetical protein
MLFPFRVVGIVVMNYLLFQHSSQDSAKSISSIIKLALSCQEC